MTEHLLQVVPSVVRKIDHNLEVDIDFCEYVAACVDNFEQVTIACSITTELMDSGLRRCRPIDDLPSRNRIRFISLPDAYNWPSFLNHYSAVSQLLKEEINNADYLIFSPHTVIGDWAMVATFEAIKLHRSYGIEADVVYGEVARTGWVSDASWKRFIKSRIFIPLFDRYYHHCLEHSGLALFQGQDVYDAYSKFSPNPFNLYHHIPVYKGDHISEFQLQRKIECLDANRPLRICYAGRAIEMKGPIEWLKIVDELIKDGVKIEATWLGDGSLLPHMRNLAADLDILANVKFPGFISDRNEIIQTLKESDIFLFCHKTRESARCLGEALACGCPLIGYGTAYPKELVARHGGGKFTQVGDWKGLARIIKGIDNDRANLRDLICAASLSGRLYDRPAKLQERIELVKKYLKPSEKSTQSTNVRISSS